MFTLTFLGHQGWLISSATTNVLIDPLLTDSFGHGGSLGRLYPPRRVDLAGFPEIDAVVLTHEHDDHFDIPSINRLDRAIPIYLSARSSVAARGLLDELGFESRSLEPDCEVEIGDLRYRSFLCDHHEGLQGDEWDVFPMLVRDVAGHGSVLSSIDVSTLPLGIEHPPRVLVHAHNTTRAEFQRLGLRAVTGSDAASQLATALRRLAMFDGCYGPPAAALICGQGWSFADERAWINHEAFPVTAAQIGDALALASPDTQVFAPAPGFTLELFEGRVVGVREAQPFIAPLPRERWPDRSFTPADTASRDYQPATGRTSVDAAQLEALLVELEDFARYLYGTAVFRSLCSMPTRIDEVAAAVGFSLRVDDTDGREILRYEPGSCSFVREPEGDPQRALLSGIECFATDLLAFMRGELSPSALCYAGRVRTWNRAPARLWFSPQELWMYGHPLRRVDRAAKLYRRLLAAEPSNPPRIRGRC